VRPGASQRHQESSQNQFITSGELEVTVPFSGRGLVAPLCGHYLYGRSVPASIAPWCSGQACWPLEPATAVRIRSGLLPQSSRSSIPVTIFEEHPLEKPWSRRGSKEPANVTVDVQSARFGDPGVPPSPTQCMGESGRVMSPYRGRQMEPYRP
jgi:hypothetical protein